MGLLLQELWQITKGVSKSVAKTVVNTVGMGGRSLTHFTGKIYAKTASLAGFKNSASYIEQNFTLQPEVNHISERYSQATVRQIEIFQNQ